MILTFRYMFAGLPLAQFIIASAALGTVPEKVMIWNEDGNLPPARIPMRSYGPDRGLVNSSVSVVRQDSDGFLWVGTEDGLYRYDGRRFVSYNLAAGLPSGHITTLVASPDGEFWVGTLRGVAERVSDGFLALGGDRGLPVEPVAGIALDGRKRVWVALPSGLYRSGADGHFTLAPGWNQGPATAVCLAGVSGETVWAAAGDRICRWTEETGWTAESVTTAGEPIEGIAIDKMNWLWVRTRGHLLAKKPDSKVFNDFSDILLTPNFRGYLNTDRSGNVMVPCNRGVLARKGDDWWVLGQDEGLPTSWARDAFEDKEGSLWIASIGIHRLLGRGAWRSWNRNQKLPSDVVWGILRDRQGRLWVTTDGGVCLAERDGWRTPAGLVGYGAKSVVQTQDGGMWLGGWERDVLHFNPRTGRVRRFSDVQGFSGGPSLVLFADSTDQVWIGTSEGGLWRVISGANPGFVREALPGDAGNERVSSIAEDSDKRLWVATSIGLYCRTDGSWQKYSSSEGLRRDHVNLVLPAKNGELWLAYFEALGVERVKVARGRVEALQHFSVSTGLVSNKVYFIGLDSRDWLWIGTGAGVNVVSPKGVRRYSMADGLAADDCDTNAFLAEANGGVFVGTSSGLSYYSGAGADEIEPPPNVCITRARVGGLSLQPGAATRSVGWRERRFEANFVGLTFISEDAIELQARLVGFDSNWWTVRSGEVTYAALPPASYRFETRARTSDGSVGPSVFVAFEIVAPWWHSWQARAFLIVLISSCLAVMVMFLRKRFNRRIGGLERQIEERTAELATAHRALSDLSVVDPLTGLKNRRFVDLAISRDIAQVKRTYRELRMGRVDRHLANTDLAFYYLDIDGLSEINATLGVQAGDVILQGMRAILSSNCRESDAVVRWETDEFVAIARNSDRAEVASLAERLRSAVERQQFLCSDGRVARCTCSIGFVTFPLDPGHPDDFTWEDSLLLAKTCATMADQMGGNCWIGVRLVHGPCDSSPAHWTPAIIEKMVKDNRIVIETSLGTLNLQV